MPDDSINTVVFDMDDVLCDYDRAARIAHMAKTTGLDPDAIVAAIWGTGFDDRADEGEFTAHTYLAETQSRLGVRISAQDWAAARKAGMTPRPVILEMAHRVAERTQVAGFTNNGPLMRDMMGDIFPEALALFGEHLYFSCDIGIGKPAPKAFLKMLERLDAEPRRTLFIDDNEGYIHGAAEAGLHVHRYVDADALAHQLQDFGLL